MKKRNGVFCLRILKNVEVPRSRFFMIMGFIIIAMTLSGCSIFGPERTFLVEMDKGPEGLFVPEEDFPVVVGDRNTIGPIDRKELKERTPQTHIEEKKEKSRRALRDELSDLEDGMPEIEYQHYLQHKKKLSSLSEKIFFIRLGNIRERDEYLLGKGFREEYVHITPAESQAIREREVVLGMSKDAVAQSWGQPLRVDIAGEPDNENERWAFYDHHGRVKYVFFEYGRVKGWAIE